MMLKMMIEILQNCLQVAVKQVKVTLLMIVIYYYPPADGSVE